MKLLFAAIYLIKNLMITTEEEKKEAQEFYREALQLLKECGVDFMLGGAFSLFAHTGIYRDTKDLDIFCKPSDYSKILQFFADKGYKTQLTDIRWLAKVFKGDYFIDIIFDTVNNICTVDDSWFEHATPGTFAGEEVKFLSPEELIWCKIYVQNRERFDGADINHVILKKGKELDWERLLSRLDQHNHWHLLLAQIIMFQFVYPSDFHEIIPQWLFDELIKRANNQYQLPATVVKVCRGPVIDQTQYSVDIKDWDYKVSTIMTT